MNFLIFQGFTLPFGLWRRVPAPPINFAILIARLITEVSFAEGYGGKLNGGCAYTQNENLAAG
ncbi:hypothetical protein TERTU_3099 [Teredinibacter turnerae T7901]|uniref:Uncharacterized protein n=1 Tax=Teredinibacter turnerae (strain ATCC 39867 / T7901) TaxID=377629 RepID=C5BP79_TERTT|nr:hypothetical protein TERTU_3099 [Teredinibacter turnerae T7901]